MSDDDWVTVEGVRYVPEAPLKAEIARMRAALEEIIRKSREDYAVTVACRALAKEGK